MGIVTKMEKRKYLYYVRVYRKSGKKTFFYRHLRRAATKFEALSKLRDKVLKVALGQLVDDGTERSIQTIRRVEYPAWFEEHNIKDLPATGRDERIIWQTKK